MDGRPHRCHPVSGYLPPFLVGGRLPGRPGFWEDKGVMMTHDNGTFDYYTGSVVVDVNNRAVLAQPWIPQWHIYTMNNRITGFQSQGISLTSLDYEQFQYYSGNPVILSNSTDFRDPQVFGMFKPNADHGDHLTAGPNIEVYASDDLISWTYLSKFEREGLRRKKGGARPIPIAGWRPFQHEMGDDLWNVLNRTQYWV